MTSNKQKRQAKKAVGLEALLDGLGDREFVPAGHPLAKRLAVIGLIHKAMENR